MREIYYDQKRDKYKWREKQPASEPPVRVQRLVMRWHWSWNRCRPFRISASFWSDKRLTVQRGFHIWFGWWRLSAVLLEQEAHNNGGDR